MNLYNNSKKKSTAHAEAKVCKRIQANKTFTFLCTNVWRTLHSFFTDVESLTSLMTHNRNHLKTEPLFLLNCPEKDFQHQFTPQNFLSLPAVPLQFPRTILLTLWKPKTVLLTLPTSLLPLLPKHQFFPKGLVASHAPWSTKVATNVGPS